MEYYRYPVNKIGITSDYGFRTGESAGFHYGLDLGWFDYQGENVCSIGNGEVIEKGFTNSAGNYVTIKHSPLDKSSYLHLKESSKLNIGDIVSMGTLIGYMGTTGSSTGVHLHISFQRNDSYIDPKTVLYVYSDQIVGESTKENYKLLYYNPIIINPTERDKTKNQLQINVSDLNIRKGPSLSYEAYTSFAKEGIYDYYDEIKNSDYTWYKIGEEAFIAYNENWITLYKKEESTDEINNKYKFKYIVSKTGKYKINLNEGETLIIK